VAAVVYLLVVVAAALALLGRPVVAPPVAVAVGALAVRTATRAAGFGIGVAVGAGLPIFAVAAAALAVAGLPSRSRTVLTSVVIATALSVAATGWLGMAWHVEPLALVSSGLWRASSTLTYANASASFLVTGLCVTASAAESLGPRRTRIVTAALLAGLLATMSRAGLLALALGLLVAVVLCTPAVRRRIAALWPAAPGAAIAAAGLVPGLTAESTPHPIVAVVALAAGLGFATLPPGRATARLLIAVVAAGAVLAVA
jgi:hypothetical protein